MRGGSAGAPLGAGLVVRPAPVLSGIAAAAALLLAAPSLVQAQLLGSLEREEVEIVHAGPLVEYLAVHSAACSLNALEFLQELYGYTPSEQVTVFLQDFSDFGHGGATTVPSNFVLFGIAPFNYVYDTIPAIDRMFWMANHEMVHIVTMDQAAGSDLTFRRLFNGKVEPSARHPESIFYNYLTNPRWNAPRWYHEGIAVFLETWMAGGLGRVLGAYDEMAFRTMVLEDSYFYDMVGLESEGTTVDFQVGVNAYLYGTRFMSYLAHGYGPEKLIEWTARRPGSKAYFTRQFAHVYGTSLDEEWRRWIEWEREWQEANLESLRRNPITSFRPLIAEALGSVSRAFFDPEERRLYVAHRRTGEIARLVAVDIDTGEISSLGKVEGGALFFVTSLAHDPKKRRLFYTANNYGWRDLMVLDLDSGEQRRLMKEARIGDLAFNRADRSLWGVRHFNGISTLVRMPEPYEEWMDVHSWPYGQDIYDLDVSPDGRLLSASLAEVDGRQTLIALSIPDLLSGEVSPRTLFDFEVSSPANFTFSGDGRYLYGSSTYTGVPNVFRYDLESGEMEIRSNAETGFFRPVPVSDDELLVFRYTTAGLVPGVIADRDLDSVGAIRFLGNEIVEEHPVVREWKVGPPSRLDPEEIERGDYSTAGNIGFNTWYPVIEGYKDTVAVGAHFDLSDPLNLSGADVTVSFSPDSGLDDDERVHAAFTFHHWGWEVSGSYNRADFYDLFGPTKTSRRGYSLGVRYDRTLGYHGPRRWSLSGSLVGWGGLETLPEAQNIAAATDSLVDGELTLEYARVLRSLGAVELEEEGVRWRLLAGGRYAASEIFPRLHSELDVGWLLPIEHSSFWLRGSAGAAFGEADEPFSKFYFGAFGNNYVDYREVKRYREPMSFPGVELNEISGRNYARLMAEWTLPPLRFRRAGWPGLYLTWARPALFSSAIHTDFDDATLSRTFYNFGVQVDLKLVLFSNLGSTLSFGYALTGGRDGRWSDELMISLKIL